MAMQLAQRRAANTPVIPDRLYFKIGDVAKICELETYVLRFWESQFPQLKPNKIGTGQRLYRRRDVELVLEIKRLVHGEGYTIIGARQALEQGHRRTASQPEAQHDPQPQLPLAVANGPGQLFDDLALTIDHARAELREIASLLRSPHPRPSRRRARLATMPSTSELLFPA